MTTAVGSTADSLTTATTAVYANLGNLGTITNLGRYLPTSAITTADNLGQPVAELSNLGNRPTNLGNLGNQTTIPSYTIPSYSRVSVLARRPTSETAELGRTNRPNPNLMDGRNGGIFRGKFLMGRQFVGK